MVANTRIRYQTHTHTCTNTHSQIEIEGLDAAIEYETPVNPEPKLNLEFSEAFPALSFGFSTGCTLCMKKNTACQIELTLVNKVRGVLSGGAPGTVGKEWLIW